MRSVIHPGKGAQNEQRTSVEEPQVRVALGKLLSKTIPKVWESGVKKLSKKKSERLGLLRKGWGCFRPFGQKNLAKKKKNMDINSRKKSH